MQGETDARLLNWRFVVPDEPGRLLLLPADGEDPAGAVTPNETNGLDSVIGMGPYDGVAVPDVGRWGSLPGAGGSANLLRRLAAQVADGGWLYVGFANPLYPLRRGQGSLSLTKALRVLDAAGLDRVDVFLALPDERCPAYLIPRSDRAALDFFLRRLFLPYAGAARGWRGTATQRLMSVLRRLALVGPHRARTRFAPAFGIVAGRSAVTHPMCASLNERWAELRPGEPPLLSALVAGPDKDVSSKVTLILFDQVGRAAAVAKVSRDETGERALMREDDVLRRFRSAGVPIVQREAPEPLVLRRDGRQLALVMSAIDGEPLLTRYYSPGHSSDPRRVARDFLAAGDWLARFQAETMAGREQCSSASIAARIEPVIESYRTQIGWGPEEEDLFAAVLARAATLDEAWVPITGVHGDYWFGNLLMSGTQVGGVVDWELGLTEGLPFSDIYKFPTSYGFYLDRAYPPGTRSIPGHGGREAIDARWARNGQWRNLPGFAYTYFGQGWFPDLVRRFILGHLERLGVSPEVNGVFFPVFLAQQAMALRDPAFRSGYRSLVVGFSRERASTWLWTHGAPSSPDRPLAALQALTRPSGGKGRRSA